MSHFDLDEFVAEAIAISKQQDAYDKIKQLMLTTFTQPEKVAAAIGDKYGKDVILHEDENISIWNVYFDPANVVPPHDHQTDVAIGIYQGTERNFIFQRTACALELETIQDLKPGDTFFLTPDHIHAAGTATSAPVQGIHIYMGELTKINRSLFDWDSGQPLSFSDEVYEGLKREPAYLTRYTDT